MRIVPDYFISVIEVVSVAPRAIVNLLPDFPVPVHLINRLCLVVLDQRVQLTLHNIWVLIAHKR